uniref:Uncharacterized protein n=1 Tax=Arundo donax TaxID=35708 RepID=A0A0A9CKD3_ARUDO
MRIQRFIILSAATSDYQFLRNLWQVFCLFNKKKKEDVQ